MADARLDPNNQPLLENFDYERSTASDFTHDSYVLQIGNAEDWAQAYGNACYAAGIEAGRAITPSPPVAAPPAAPALHSATEDFLASYRAKYRNNGKGGMRANAPMLKEVTALNAAFRAAAQPQPQPAQPLTGAPPLSDEQIAIRTACSQIIKSLADIVTAPIADDQPFAETVRREPLMQRVQEIKAQVDAIHKALPHPMMQAAPSTPTPPEVAP